MTPTGITVTFSNAKQEQSPSSSEAWTPSSYPCSFSSPILESIADPFGHLWDPEDEIYEEIERQQQR